MSDTDWRRQGQEQYLAGRQLIHRRYEPCRPGWEHDHCEFCHAKISCSTGDLNEGYCTEDGYYWICSACHDDFEVEFGWSVGPPGGAP